MTILIAIIMVIFFVGFVAGYMIHGWEFDKSLKEIEERVKRLE